MERKAIITAQDLVETSELPPTRPSSLGWRVQAVYLSKDTAKIC